MIQQIRSAKFTPRTAKTAPDKGKVANAETDTGTSPESTQVRKDVAVEPNTPSAAISEKTLSMIREQLKNPEKLDDPFGLAELLFTTGNLGESADCYIEAVRRKDPNEPDPTEDCAWMVFQIGNCLRTSDPQKARRYYARLLEQYPESVWTELAKTRIKMIAWLEQNKPKQLIDSYKPGNNR